jgi:hypothetical protein
MWQRGVQTRRPQFKSLFGRIRGTLRTKHPIQTSQLGDVAQFICLVPTDYDEHNEESGNQRLPYRGWGAGLQRVLLLYPPSATACIIT